MIVFDHEKARFNLRVVGVALHGDRVLLHRTERDDFWALPGGRAELLEPARETLAREMREELGAEVRVGRLVWVVENFFSYEGTPYHELALYFEMSLPPERRLLDRDEFQGSEALPDGGTLRLIFRWFPLTELEGVRLFPSFLRTALRSLPEGTEHVVHVDEEELR